MKKLIFFRHLLISLILSVFFLGACKEEPPVVTTKAPIASFQFTLDADNDKKVNFTNVSQNATSYKWDFGDSTTSTEETPTKTYADYGTYTVGLVAYNDDGDSSSLFTKTVELTAPVDSLTAQQMLTGTAGKTWQLLADISTDRFPLVTGNTANRSEIWWAFGGHPDFDDLCKRNCIMNDTWTFNTNGEYVYDNKGDFWGEAGVWAANIGGTCFDAISNANFVGENGKDLSGWNSGTYNYTYDPTAKTLTVTGGFIGLSKAGTDAEVLEPQSSVTYSVIDLIDANVDTLILETSVPVTGGYWRSVLVSYDNPTDEVVIDPCPAVDEVNITFSLNTNGYTGTVTSPSVNGTSKLGEFTSGLTDTDSNGIWEVSLALPSDDTITYLFSIGTTAETLDANNPACTKTTGTTVNRFVTTAMEEVTLPTVCWESCDDCSVSFSLSDLEGTWKVASEAGALKIGPTSGSGDWWTSTADDVMSRACFFDDAYTFNMDSSFSIDLGTETWLETWQGVTTETCGSPVAPHNGSGSYTYTLNNSNVDSVTITLNGQGAYVGLPKAINGDELEMETEVPTSRTYTIKQYVTTATQKRLTVEIFIGQPGGDGYWTFILTSPK